MNRIDIIIIGLVFLSAVAGTFRGMVGELISILSSVGGFWAAVWCIDWVTAHLLFWISIQTPLAFVSVFFSLCFLGNLLIGITVGVLYRHMKPPSMGVIQRVLGSVLGMFKGLLFVSLLAWLPAVLRPIQHLERTGDESVLFKPIRAVAPAFLEWTTGMTPRTESNFEKVKEQFARLRISDVNDTP